MKILNAYAGIGGNRKLWGNEHKITAVEINPEIAAVYQRLFPQDTVIVGDAHEYIEKHYSEFDYIWSSPPCQTHSRVRYQLGVQSKNKTPAVYPDMKLWQEIIFLKHHAKCKWIVENVNPYYEPLIPPDILLQRHYFWSNFFVMKKDFDRARLEWVGAGTLAKQYGYDMKALKGISDKRAVLRNCVMPEIGEHILNSIL